MVLLQASKAPTMKTSSSICQPPFSPEEKGGKKKNVAINKKIVKLGKSLRSKALLFFKKRKKPTVLSFLFLFFILLPSDLGGMRDGS